jgi:hypothetical protein
LEALCQPVLIGHCHLPRLPSVMGVTKQSVLM